MSKHLPRLLSCKFSGLSRSFVILKQLPCSHHVETRSWFSIRHVSSYTQIRQALSHVSVRWQAVDIESRLNPQTRLIVAAPTTSENDDSDYRVLMMKRYAMAGFARVA